MSEPTKDEIYQRGWGSRGGPRWTRTSWRTPSESTRPARNRPQSADIKAIKKKLGARISRLLEMALRVEYPRVRGEAVGR
jgi:hypothetical protein